MKRLLRGFAVFLAGISAALMWNASAQAGPVSGQGTWQTTLLGRDINGNAVASSNASAVFLYDTDLNVTWLRDANANAANGNKGFMTWSAANNWANTLTVGAFSGWRLPTMFDPGPCNYSNAGGTDCGYNVRTKSGSTVYSEMAYLWYVELGNNAFCPPGLTSCKGPGVPQPGWGLSNTGDFQNMQAGAYWSGLEYAPDKDNAWVFSAGNGFQGLNFKSNPAALALAVRPGDVLQQPTVSVPEPQGLVLLLSALAGMAVVRRRRPVVHSR